MTFTTAVSDPVPPSAYPSFETVSSPPPAMPPAWTATVLLHPFSPPLSTDPKPDNPFFQLCVANVACVPGKWFSAQVAGCSYGRWWYVVTPEGTKVSTDGGRTWTAIDLGWSLPSDWFGAQRSSASCVGSSPLNWMAPAPVNWWKIPVPIAGSPPAATWLWFDSDSNAPVRMMFGEGPPKPTQGDPTQLAFFQMWSFTYFPTYTAHDSEEKAPARPQDFTTPTIPGFSVGNPNGYQNFTWNTNFGMTAFMTPVNENYNPLPTRVLYVWKDAPDYQSYSDRAQNTLMQYNYNSGEMGAQEALLTGPAPNGVQPPPESGTGFLINFNWDGTSSCIGGSQFPFAQEPPDWVQIPAVEGTIQATISSNPVIAPDTTVTIFSVLFPPAPPNYPEATYLWTWYAPQNATGTESRPVTFMQSQSGVNVGTSLALADYYYYEAFTQPIDPSNFDIPSACGIQTQKSALRRRLP
ncbi:hypothetical protein [Burkholderia sp. Ax-1719]|uniref:hypothetical protein n=1 Tax=Burkholderia sp. Ax-1719 TaxID=2608334 RepID=UPI0014206DCA|nr:hypothetical protein [Burkholderia sp. Ax-1719]NIE63207.1 hypothetical protein [Burkholderia sp. Ax-1719]